jgi:hypothetical protein
MEQPTFGTTFKRVVYLTVPVVIDGEQVSIDLTDDGEPGPWGNVFVYEGETGRWEIDHGSKNWFMRAWDHLAAVLEAGQ